MQSFLFGDHLPKRKVLRELGLCELSALAKDLVREASRDSNLATHQFAPRP